MSIADGVDDGWLALVGVGAGYGIAVGLVFLLFFVAPYLAVAAL
ncbi:hypothetical protein J2744_001372 [Halorubrum trapanicum]|uniref:Uncharacterized protein n=1 Tax=Halorubrum trapanicum TaxID=29284 RepID=A0A8J7UNB7_9EURY|nr:hypothetical protein [Halorubrum trapanicum]MBP1901696.1 hypothetical protein [Halorubrum trapanicum]